VYPPTAKILLKLRCVTARKGAISASVRTRDRHGTGVAAWQHAVRWFNEKCGGGCLRQPARDVAVRVVEDVEAWYRRAAKTNSGRCRQVTPASRSPYFNMLRIDEAVRARSSSRAPASQAGRQDAPVVYGHDDRLPTQRVRNSSAVIAPFDGQVRAWWSAGARPRHRYSLDSRSRSAIARARAGVWRCP